METGNSQDSITRKVSYEKDTQIEIFNHTYREIWKLDLNAASKGRNTWCKLKSEIHQVFARAILPFHPASGSIVQFPSSSSPDDNSSTTFIYSGGSDYPFHLVSNDIYALKINSLQNTYKCHKIAELPFQIYLHSSCLHLNIGEQGGPPKLFIFGGMKRLDARQSGYNLLEQSCNQFYEVDLNSKAVKTLESPGISCMRTNMICYENKIYMLPSSHEIKNVCTDFLINFIHVYDIKRGIWSKQELFQDDAKDLDYPLVIYASSREAFFHRDAFGSRERRNPTSKTILMNKPLSRWRHAHATFQNKFLIISGGQFCYVQTDHEESPISLAQYYLARNSDLTRNFLEKFTERFYFKDIWSLDLETFKWTFKGFLPRGLSFHSQVVTTKGKLYNFGGKVSNMNFEGTADKILERSNQCYELDLGLQVEKLTDICERVIFKSATN